MLKCPFHQIQNISEFDALDPAARENPYPFYDWLRSEKSVYKVPHETDFYMVHRYEDVKSVFADTLNFSNEIIPTAKSPFLALMDGDYHSRIREIVATLFTQKNINLWEPRIHQLVETTTNNLFQTKPVDLFETWANVIPLSTLAALFNLDTSPTSISTLHDHSIAINKALFVTGGTGPRRSSNPTVSEKIKISWSLIKNVSRILKLRRYLGAAGMNEFGKMIRINDRKLAVPRPNFEHLPAAVGPMLDLMLLFADQLTKTNSNEKHESILVLQEAIKKGDATLVEMIMAGTFILFAGYETTTSLLSNCFVHLSRNPEMFNSLKAHPEKIDDYIEESMRYFTPVGRFLRRAKNDVMISETVIPKNAIVIVMAGAANTDPEKFENGCAFNMERNNNKQHLSFGKGVHFCVGAPLARMQVSLSLKALITRAKKLQIDETSPMKMVTDRDNGILRYEKLMVNVS